MHCESSMHLWESISMHYDSVITVLQVILSSIPTLISNPMLNNGSQKASTMLWACKMLGNSQRGLTPKDKQLIYITTTLPILSYGFQLWFHHKSKHCKGLVQCLNQVHTAAACWITGGFPNCNARALQCMAGLQPLHTHLEKLYHSLAYAPACCITPQA